MWCKSYGRKSRALGDPDTLAVEEVVAHQLEACDRWAAQQGVTLRAEHRLAEIGSGESIAGRPRFAALLNDLEHHPPGEGLLVVSEVARLSRADMEEIGRIMRILRTAGVKVLAGGRLFDLNLPDDEQYFVFLAANARHEIRQFSWRMQLKRDKQLRDGEVRLGAACWGYVFNRNTRRLEADPVAFPILSACCGEVITTSTLALSRKYGVPQATLWTSLTNPTICGYPSVHWGPSEKDPKRYRRLPRSEWKWAGQRNDTYPHACTRAEFEAIQQVLDWRRTKKTVGREAWCRDIVTFLDDPGPVWISCCRVGTRPHTHGHPVYERRQEKRRTSYIERDKVHAAVEQEVLTLFREPERLRKIVQRYIQTRAEAQSPDRRDIESQLTVAWQRYQQAVDAEYDAEEPLRTALHNRSIRLEAEWKALDRIRQQQHTRPPDAALAEQLLALLERLPRGFERWWRQAEEQQKRWLVPAIIQRVEVRCVKKGGRIRVREVVQVVPQPWVNGGG